MEKQEAKSTTTTFKSALGSFAAHLHTARICLKYLTSRAECTKIVHRRSLPIFTADEGISGKSAVRIIFTRFHRRKNRGSLAIFFAEEIAHLGASKSRTIFPGAVKITAATAENHAILVHSDPEQLQKCTVMSSCNCIVIRETSKTSDNETKLCKASCHGASQEKELLRQISPLLPLPDNQT